MKKFFACLAVMLLILSFGVGAFANPTNEYGDGLTEGSFSSGETQEITDVAGQQGIEMTVNFDVIENYTVTIPASIDLSGSFSGGFSGKAEIEAFPQLNGSRAVIVSLNLNSSANPSYYVGNTLSSNFSPNTELSKVVFTPGLNKNGAYITDKVSVEVSGTSPLKAFGGNAENGVMVVTATGTTPSSNELNYSVTGVDGLSSGSYSFVQTFDITVS